MSSTKARDASLALDESGNIDADRLSRELTEALEFDIAYKKKDNMKKRAVRSAPSYDAFKNMVACAHLKTVRYIHLMILAEGSSDRLLFNP
jgi:hypothetical protein